MNLKARKAIHRFNKAKSSLQRAEKALDKIVDKEVVRRNTIDELERFVDLLPPTYFNCRKVYRKIALIKLNEHLKITI